MENAYIIKGGKQLKGEIKLSGSKNIALKMLIAALMFDSVVELKNVPAIDDVLELIHLIKLLGGRVSMSAQGDVKIDGRKLKVNKVDLLHGSKIRVSFMFFAPLLMHFGEAYIPNPGGCRLGARSIDRIVEGLRAIGIKVDYDSSTGYYKSQIKGKIGGKYSFPKPSHTGTELLILAGLLTDTAITIENAALEPEIDELIKFLNEAGAYIKREGKTINILGKKNIQQKKPFAVASDRNEAITFAALAIATHGDIRIGNIEEHYIASFVDKLTKIGGGVERLSHDKWRFYYKGDLKSLDITTEPYPGFMTDWQPFWAILMTQAQGKSILHERLFENRFSYVDELCKLGAKIEYVDVDIENPHTFYHFNFKPGEKYRQAIAIYGGQDMHNGVVTIADLRAGATLAIAALAVSGETVVNGVSNIKRGYESFVEKIRSLGGDIVEL